MDREKQTEDESGSGENDSVNNTQPVSENPDDKSHSKKHNYLKIAFIVLLISIITFSLLNFILSFYDNTSNVNVAAAQALLRAESNMVFVEQVYNRVFFIENTTQLGPVNRTDNQLLLSVNYILQAGINLSDLELRTEADILLVSYSKPQIFSIKIDYESLNLMFGQRYRTLFNPNNIRFSHFLPVINGGVKGMAAVTENNRVVREEIVSIEDIAMQGGLEQIVKNNAEWWFSNYLNILGFNNIIFELRQ